jgi:hypothetical protein
MENIVDNERQSCINERQSCINERQSCIPSSTDALDNGNPLAIAWLDQLRMSISLCTCNNLH